MTDIPNVIDYRHKFSLTSLESIIEQGGFIYPSPNSPISPCAKKKQKSKKSKNKKKQKAKIKKIKHQNLPCEK